VIVFVVAYSNHSNADLLGLSTPPSQQQQQSSQNTLIDVLGDIYNPAVGVNNTKK